MITTETIQWRTGYRQSHKAKVEDVDAEFNKIREEYSNEVPVEILVKRAKDKRNVCHKFFNWDDTKAAHEHRLTQARGLVAAVWVIKYEDDKPTAESRKYEVTRSAYEPQKKVYKHIDDVLSDPEARKALLHRAMGELNAARRRYKRLKELADVFKELDKVMVR